MRGVRTAARGATAALVALAVCAAGAAVAAAPAAAVSLQPPRPRVMFGVSDTGRAPDFFEFERMVGQHPALLETFHPWGNSLPRAYERWRRTAVRPVLHISTADDKTLEELITPKQIARGDGDEYLLELNRFFGETGLPAYVRPLGEPNRCLNVYAAFDCDGSPRDSEHTAVWYKQAFRRIVTIVRGGGTVAEIDAELAELRMPPIRFPADAEPPESLPATPVAFIWSPLPAGSPRVAGNWPANFWPGSRWVDWAGTDFYSVDNSWRDLRRMFRQRLWRDKPFALTEWAVSSEDDPRFVRRLVYWIVHHRRVRMFVYYRGFGEDLNPYRLDLYPRTMGVLRRSLRRRSFPPYVRRHAATFPSLSE